MSIEQRILELIANRYGSVRACAASIDLPYTTLRSMLDRGIKNANFSNVERLCLALNIDMETLSGPSTELLSTRMSVGSWTEPLTAAYATAPRFKQETVCTVLDIEYVEPGADNSDILFRISEQSAAAGDGIYLGPESFCEIYVNVNLLPPDAAFGIPVRGDSMEPLYHNGDILIVSTEEPRIGEVGVFTLDGSGYVKKRGARELISLNEKYDPIPMNETIRCNGKVIGTLDKKDIYG